MEGAAPGRGHGRPPRGCEGAPWRGAVGNRGRRRRERRGAGGARVRATEGCPRSQTLNS